MLLRSHHGLFHIIHIQHGSKWRKVSLWEFPLKPLYLLAAGSRKQSKGANCRWTVTERHQEVTVLFYQLSVRGHVHMGGGAVLHSLKMYPAQSFWRVSCRHDYVNCHCAEGHLFRSPHKHSIRCSCCLERQQPAVIKCRWPNWCGNWGRGNEAKKSPHRVNSLVSGLKGIIIKCI